MSEKKIYTRKSFVTLLGLAPLSIALLNRINLRMFSSKSVNKAPKISIHSSAVPRTKKGSRNV